MTGANPAVITEAKSIFQIFDELPSWVRQQLKDIITNDEDLSDIYYAWKSGDDRYLRDTIRRLIQEETDLYQSALDAMSAAEKYKPREDAKDIRAAYLQAKGAQQK